MWPYGLTDETIVPALVVAIVVMIGVNLGCWWRR